MKDPATYYAMDCETLNQRTVGLLRTSELYMPVRMLTRIFLHNEFCARSFSTAC